MLKRTKKIDKIPLFSPAKSEARLERMFKLKETKYRMCPNRCRLFPQFSNHPCKCKEKQFNPNGKPIATMSYFPLARQLAYFIANNDIRSSLYQTMTQEHSPGMLKDIFDGSVYKELKPNLFPNQSMDDLDLAISLFIDGFASFKGGSSKMTIVHIVFLSLPPNERLVFIFFFILCILTWLLIRYT